MTTQAPRADKSSLISSIIELNPSATSDFLDSFPAEALRRYLDNLTWARTPRASAPVRVRPAGEPGIMSRSRFAA